MKIAISLLIFLSAAHSDLWLRIFFTISGKVIDANSRGALVGVTRFDTKSEKGNLTGSNGAAIDIDYH